jgi:histidyl-tRNA synthetase
MFDIISKSYKQYGFTPIETPMVENNSVLVAKGG